MCVGVFDRGHVIRFVVCLGNVLLVVGVDFCEGDVIRAGERVGELLVEGGDGLAWAAPVGVD